MLGIAGLMIWNVSATFFCYFRLRKKKQLFDDRYATTMTNTATMGITLVLGMHVTVLMSAGLSLVFLVNLLLGVVIGTLFGALAKYHSVLSGLYNGLIGASMGVMIGEVLKNPQICSIPISNHTQILLNMYQLCGFATLLLTVVVGLVLYSMRV
ncbi:hypothetical protein [Bhargavaea massiliensis]|uniref:hypothetical protein n=1 Tax=Bhargavaea massiliensis TaxID=2697500 RepID=UPI001BCE8A02|nr:hypothetical protein [Bhargavaea massiliensis]